MVLLVNEKQGIHSGHLSEMSPLSKSVHVCGSFLSLFPSLNSKTPRLHVFLLLVAFLCAFHRC